MGSPKDGGRIVTSSGSHNTTEEEFKHFSMDLEILLRCDPTWRAIAQEILFTEGDIVQHGEEAEDEAG